MVRGDYMSTWNRMVDSAKGGRSMDRHTIVTRLMMLPAEIEVAEKKVLEAVKAVDMAREKVASIEAEAVLNGKITGKNETERKAQIAAMTAEARKAVVEAEAQLNSARASYNRLIIELKALRAVAQLLGGEVV